MNCRKCKVKNCFSKIINILIANHNYAFPCYNVRVCSFTLSLTKFIWKKLNNFLKYHQKPFIHEWKTNKIIAYWNESAKYFFRLDCEFKFYRIHQNLTSIRINIRISSVSAIRINLSHSMMNPNKFTLVWTQYYRS